MICCFLFFVFAFLVCSLLCSVLGFKSSPNSHFMFHEDIDPISYIKRVFGTFRCPSYRQCQKIFLRFSWSAGPTAASTVSAFIDDVCPLRCASCLGLTTEDTTTNGCSCTSLGEYPRRRADASGSYGLGFALGALGDMQALGPGRYPARKVRTTCLWSSFVR